MQHESVSRRSVDAIPILPPTLKAVIDNEIQPDEIDEVVVTTDCPRLRYSFRRAQGMSRNRARRRDHSLPYVYRARDSRPQDHDAIVCAGHDRRSEIEGSDSQNQGRCQYRIRKDVSGEAAVARHDQNEGWKSRTRCISNFPKAIPANR